MVSGVRSMMSEALGMRMALTSAQEIQERIDRLLDRYLTTKGEERQRTTLQLMALKEALEDART